MLYKEFGKTGMKVSAMALGTWGIGGIGWDDYPEETRVDAIRASVEGGVNFFDTAPAYNAGAAERTLGKALKDIGARKDVIIATKCGNEYIGGQYVRNGDPEVILRECEVSLNNLQTDYIDLYLIHWPDPTRPLEATIEALNKLKKEGKILHFGVCNFTRPQLEEVMRYGDIEALQLQYSMVNRQNEDFMKWAAGQGVGVMTYGSLGGGILTGAYREFREYDPADSRNRFYKHFHEPLFSKVMKLLGKMDGFSAEHGNIPLAQIALNWNASQPFVSSCIVGAQSRAKVLQNCAAFEWSLKPEEAAQLNKFIEECLD